MKIEILSLIIQQCLSSTVKLFQKAYLSFPHNFLVEGDSMFSHRKLAFEKLPVFL